MNDNKLIKTLNAIGKECFVDYFDCFTDDSLSNEEIAQKIFDERGYTRNSCNSRTSHSRSIIKSGRGKDALTIITNSNKPVIQQKALRLIQKNYKNEGLSQIELKHDPSKSLHSTNSSPVRFNLLPYTPFPEWPRPSSDELILIAKLIAKYTKFLNPEIVQKVVESNEQQNANWCNLLKIKKIKHELYLWEKCATAFPGVRRHVGQKEINNVKNQKRHIPLFGEAVEIDDNDYPKEIWSFILSGNKFRKKGPTGYELAHLADHKEHNNRCAKEFVIKDINHSIAYFGLFTCPTNTVYIPSALLRPTDFLISLRLLLLRRSNQLYGRFCKILPPAYDLPELHEPEWDINKFEWADPVGDVSNVDNFLLYRQGKLDNMLKTTA